MNDGNVAYNHDDLNNHKENIWTWTTDSVGRITSISSNFSVLLGALAAKTVVGNSFWGFCDNIDSPNSDWKDLAALIREKRRIKKFVFSYNAQGKFVKLKISGVPVFDKGRFIGHTGTGQLCSQDEYTTAELSQDVLSIALERLDIGIGFFDDEGTLQDYNEKFTKYLSPAGVAVSRHMTLATLISHVKACNTIHGDFQEKSENYQELMIETRNHLDLMIKICDLPQGGYSIKVEPIHNIAQDMKKNLDKLRYISDENISIKRRLEDYKNKLDHAIREKPNQTAQDNEIEKILSFYESQMDIGILITDMTGKPQNINYFACEIFNYRTAREFLSTITDIQNLSGYDPRRQDLIQDMLEKSQSRYERDIDVVVDEDNIKLKEVITIYPSVVSPQKIISFFYPEKTQDIYEQIVQATTDEPNNDMLFNSNFIEYVLNNIKTSVQVISGYSDLVNTPSEPSSQISDNHINHINHINQSCTSILEKISDVAHLYTAFSDNNQFKHNNFDPETIIHRICSKFNNEVVRKNIDFMIELSQHGLSLICDEVIFESAIGKLVSNAITMSHGGHNISLRITGHEASKKLSIVISDESSFNLKELLQSTHDTDTFNPIHNIVFNLKIAKVLLEKMGFSVYVTSFSDLGNTITITASPEILNRTDECNVNDLYI